MKKAVTILLMLFAGRSYAQYIKQPAEEGFHSPSPVYGPAYKMPSENTAPQTKLVTATDLENKIKPVLPNPKANTNLAADRRKEWNKTIDEIKTQTSQTADNYTQSGDFAAQTAPYTNALKQLQDMLTGAEKPSLAVAYYTVEQAYGETYLSPAEYHAAIKQSADFIKQWMAQNGQNENDPDALHGAIQKFMSQGMHVTTAKNVQDKGNKLETTTHLPFIYDYSDFEGAIDYRNFFVTRCLATGAGQCNSLPAVYMLLAEALGAQAYMCMATQHSFIKYRRKDGIMENYEATGGWHMNDKWYADNLFVTPRAIRSGIYMDTMNKQQLIANCVLDLATGYLRKYGAGDGKFISECINTATQYNGGKKNIYANFVYSSYMARMLNRAIKRNNIKDVAGIQQVPDAAKIYTALQENEKQIKELGYQPMPPQAYNQLLQQHKQRDTLQQQLHINGKEKRNLFLKSN